MSLESKTEIDFLGHLKTVYSDRFRNNSSYSLRAYAKSLGVDASPLSAILNGKRPISKKMKLKLGTALGIQSSELHLYKTESEKTKEILSNNYDAISDATFSVLADWYYFPILELFGLQDFENDSKWMAKKLQLSHTVVCIALENLVTCGFLSSSLENNKETWARTNQTITSHLVPNKTSILKQCYQKQLLELSTKAIYNQTLESRNHTSVVCSINRRDLNKAKAIITKFRSEMLVLFNQSKNKDDIYQLQVSLFSLLK